MTGQRGMQYLRAPGEEKEEEEDNVDERWSKREALWKSCPPVSEWGSLSPPTNGIWGQFKLDRVIQGAWSIAQTERLSGETFSFSGMTVKLVATRSTRATRADNGDAGEVCEATDRQRGHYIDNREGKWKMHCTHTNRQGTHSEKLAWITTHTRQ